MTSLLRTWMIVLAGCSAGNATPSTQREPKATFSLEARSPHSADASKVAQLPQRIVRRAGSPALPAADVIAIHELLSRVYLAEDSLDREALRDAVAPNFILEDSVTGRSVGRDAFANLVIEGEAFRAGNRHMALDIAVAGDGKDRAVAVHYLLAIRVFSPDAKTPDLPQALGHGIVRDELVKDADGIWRLAHRVSDQVAIQPTILADGERRAQAARVIAP